MMVRLVSIFSLVAAAAAQSCTSLSSVVQGNTNSPPAGLGIPDALLDQLAIGGRLIAPVARNANAQQLLLIERVSSQRYQRTVLDEVFFVPLQSGVI